MMVLMTRLPLRQPVPRRKNNRAWWCSRCQLGQLILQRVLTINRSQFVLRGVGSGEDGSIISVPIPLGEMDNLPDKIQKAREYIIKNDKRHGKKLFSPFSWNGGVLRFAPPKGEMKHLADIVAGSRGGHAVEVDRVLQVPANTMASIVWYRESGDDSLLEHVLWYHGRGHYR